MHSTIKLAGFAAAITFISLSAHAFDAEAAKTRVQGDLSKVSTPALIKAVEASNAKHAGATEADIKKMDADWKAQTTASAKPLIDSVLNSSESKALKDMATASGGFYTEIFVMDNKGLNVAQSAVTSDYWQGDEPKFQKSFGASSTFVDEVEKDESTQTYQTQISVPLKDAAGKMIGAVTFGVAAK